MLNFLSLPIPELTPELTVFLVSATPIFELRGAIPLALGFYNFGLVKTLVITLLGNFLPAIILLWFLGPTSNYLIKKFSRAQKFFDWLFARTRQKFIRQHELLGEIALLIFVAIPLPMTGVWTGSVAAFLFGIPKKKALIFIALGEIIAGLIVTATTLGIINLF